MKQRQIVTDVRRDRLEDRLVELKKRGYTSVTEIKREVTSYGKSIFKVMIERTLPP